MGRWKCVVFDRVRFGVMSLLLLSSVTVGRAEEPKAPEPIEESQELAAPEVFVSATRAPSSLGSLNQSVTVVTEQQIQQQIAVSPVRSLGQILPKLVPGMSMNDGSFDSQTSQKIRGREINVLIDGVPQLSSPTVQFDLNHIDPAAIERIEIVRGATAIYGNGGTGGLINIITKQPGEGKPSFYTDVQGSASLTRILRGLSGSVTQGIQGRKDWFDYNVVGTFNYQGGMFDDGGHRTMPGTNGVGGFADTRGYNILGKFGATFGEHRLQLSFNRKESEQHTNYLSDPSLDGRPPTTARFISGLSLNDQPRLKNTQISVDYSHPHLFLDSRVHLQGTIGDRRPGFRRSTGDYSDRRMSANRHRKRMSSARESISRPRFPSMGSHKSPTAWTSRVSMVNQGRASMISGSSMPQADESFARSANGPRRRRGCLIRLRDSLRENGHRSPRSWCGGESVTNGSAFPAATSRGAMGSFYRRVHFILMPRSSTPGSSTTSSSRSICSSISAKVSMFRSV